MSKLVLEINQGCPRGYSFTAQQRRYDAEQDTWVIEPLDLTDKQILLQVKPSPYYSVRPFIQKLINTTENDNGFISDATGGVFQLQFSMEDTLRLPPAEYPMLIYMVDENNVYTNLGGDGNNNPILRVCHQ